MAEAGWRRDPSGRYHQRYFDGARWTEHVADATGTTGTDWPPASARQAGRPSAGSTRRGAASGGGGSPHVPVPTLLLAAGSVLVIVSLVFLPWIGSLRAASVDAQLRGTLTALALSGATGADDLGVVETSYFAGGWVVTLSAVAAALILHRTRDDLAAKAVSVVVVLNLVWALVSTLVLKSWSSELVIALGESGTLPISFGFFVGLLGMALVAAAPFAGQFGAARG